MMKTQCTKVSQKFDPWLIVVFPYEIQYFGVNSHFETTFQIEALPKQSTSGASSMLLQPPPPFSPFSFIFPVGPKGIRYTVYQFQLGKQTS